MGYSWRVTATVFPIGRDGYHLLEWGSYSLRDLVKDIQIQTLASDPIRVISALPAGEYPVTAEEWAELLASNLAEGRDDEQWPFFHEIRPLDDAVVFVVSTHVFGY